MPTANEPDDSVTPGAQEAGVASRERSESLRGLHGSWLGVLAGAVFWSGDSARGLALSERAVAAAWAPTDRGASPVVTTVAVIAVPVPAVRTRAAGIARTRRLDITGTEHRDQRTDEDDLLEIVHDMTQQHMVGHTAAVTCHREPADAGRLGRSDERARALPLGERSTRTSCSDVAGPSRRARPARLATARGRMRVRRIVRGLQ